MVLNKINIEKSTFDFKTVVIVITILSTWYDQKGDNRVRDMQHIDYEKRITRLEGFHEPKPISAVSTYNKVAVLAERAGLRKERET